MNIHEYSAHGFCFLWDPTLISMHVFSDAVIAISYAVISASLMWARSLLKENGISKWAFRSFAIFIAACGMTHVFSIITIFIPIYLAEGVIKLATALASSSTALIVYSLTRDLIKQRSARSTNLSRADDAAALLTQPDHHP